MESIAINPFIAYGLVAVVIVAVVAWAILTFKRRGVDSDTPFDTVDKVLWVLTIPLLIVGAAAAVIGLSQAKKKDQGNNEVLEPDQPTDPGESRSDQVARVIEDRAEEVEDHVLNDATDDEVAARGAGLFDPGTPDSDSA